MMAALKWLNDNREWIGGIVVVLTILAALWKFKRNKEGAGTSQSQRSGDASHNVQAGRDINIGLPPLGSDSAASSASILKDLDHRMPDIFGPLRAWLKENPFGYEFCVLRSHRVMLHTQSQPRHRFNADEIPDLIAKVKVLEDHGFLRDVTPTTVKIYRMSPDFVAYLTTPR